MTQFIYSATAERHSQTAGNPTTVSMKLGSCVLALERRGDSSRVFPRGAWIALSRFCDLCPTLALN